MHLRLEMWKVSGSQLLSIYHVPMSHQIMQSNRQQSALRPIMSNHGISILRNLRNVILHVPNCTFAGCLVETAGIAPPCPAEIFRRSTWDSRWNQHFLSRDGFFLWQTLHRRFIDMARHKTRDLAEIWPRNPFCCTLLLPTVHRPTCSNPVNDCWRACHPKTRKFSWNQGRNEACNTTMPISHAITVTSILHSTSVQLLSRLNLICVDPSLSLDMSPHLKLKNTEFNLPGRLQRKKVEGYQKRETNKLFFQVGMNFWILVSKTRGIPQKYVNLALGKVDRKYLILQQPMVWKYFDPNRLRHVCYNFRLVHSFIHSFHSFISWVDHIQHVCWFYWQRYPVLPFAQR